MKYIVLDLEWNQPRHPRETVRQPVYLSGEIIQIGAVKLNSKFRIRRRLRLSVVPQFYKKVHRKVSQITGLSNEDLKHGIPFPKAVKKLLRFCGKEYRFLTWGPEDIHILRDNFLLHGLDESKIPEFYDLQVIFAKQIAGTNRQFSLSQAMEMLEEGDFDAHDALNDAYSTDLVCRHLNMEQGLKEYPLLANEITVNPLETKELSVHFPDKSTALKELCRSPFLAPDGTDFLLPDGVPVSQNTGKYLCLARGEEGKEYLLRFRFFRSQSGQFRTVRELYPLSEALLLFYSEKKKQQEAKRLRERIRKKKKAKAAVQAASHS
jgi:DNA polymerase III epsilon subunit-like protein